MPAAKYLAAFEEIARRSTLGKDILIGVAVMYFLLGAEFLGAAQLIVYVGGTLVPRALTVDRLANRIAPAPAKSTPTRSIRNLGCRAWKCRS